MTAASYGSLPFQEQIDFFRGRVSIDTDAWTDVYNDEHDIAFMVAGARGEVLNDLRGSIDRMIAEGATIEDFRRDFREIVQRTGWAYNGGENWRTRVIYETNLRQSYHAGREAQMADPELRRARPYGIYRHGGSQDPRPEHLALDGTVLPLDDPWWDVYSPQNGWGCSCKKYTLSEEDVRRMGLTVAESPEIEWEEKEIGVRGPSPRTVRVPKGIDPGFEHRPGRNRLGDAGERYMASLARMDPDIAASLLSSAPVRERALNALVEKQRLWLDALETRGVPRNELIHVGAMSLTTLRALEQRGKLPASAGITLRDREAMHTLRDAKQEALTSTGRGKALSRADVENLPRILSEPDAVLWDTQDEALVYAFPAADGAGKIVVRVDYKEKVRDGAGRRERILTNSVRTGGIVEEGNLRQQRYEVLEGSIGE